MVFVEGFRLLLVLAGAIGGMQVGRVVSAHGHDSTIGMLVGALLAYVIGGIIGRLLDRGLQSGIRNLRRTPPAEVFAGSIVGTTGLLIGAVGGLPLLVLVHSSLDVPVMAALAWLLAALGIRIGVTKGREILRILGLARLTSQPAEPLPGTALLVDTSALLDRQLLVLGRSGLLGAGLVIPRFVIDEARTLADGPDPVTSRRARRGLEAIEALRASGVDIRTDGHELPEVNGTDAKVLVLAHRLGTKVATCSGEVVADAFEDGVDVLDLRQLSADLTPDHPPGEHLVVELLREGTQPRQAIGYLPDGDMVVVNNAAHLVGQTTPVTVLSTRQTSQGLLIFGSLTSSLSAEGRQLETLEHSSLRNS